MTDEEAIHDDEVEESLDEEIEDDEDDAEITDSDEIGIKPSSSGKKQPKEESVEEFSIAARQKVRDELDAQIAAFLAGGGRINEVAPNVTADPPKKPTPDYGGRPI